MKKLVCLYFIIFLTFLLYSCSHNKKEIQLVRSNSVYQLEYNSDSKKPIYSISMDITYDITKDIDIIVNNYKYNLSVKGHKTITADYYSKNIVVIIHNHSANGKLAISLIFKSL